jgi:hypothetical protein
MHCISFPKHPLAHFSESQIISENYLCILVIVVTIKLTTRYFGVNPTLLDSETCYLATGVLIVCFEQVRHLQACWSELGIPGYVWNTLVLIGLTMLLKSYMICFRV